MTTDLDSPLTRTSTTQRPTSSRAAVAALLVAGAAWTAGQALLPDMGLEWAERYDAVAAARGREAAATALLFAAGAALVVAAVSLARLVRRRTRSVAVGTALLGLGGVWLCAGRAAFNIHFLSATAPGVTRDQGLAVMTSSSPAFAVFPLTLLALLAGPVVLGLAVRRTTWLPLALWVVGLGVFIGSEFRVKALEVVGVAIAGAALVVLGRALTALPATDGDPRRA